MEWVNIRERMPELNTNILVTCKVGHYWAEIDGSEDNRHLEILVGYLHDEHEHFKALKSHIVFCVDCGCSGPEFDREDYEVTHWMPLPELPRE